MQPELRGRTFGLPSRVFYCSPFSCFHWQLSTAYGQQQEGSKIVTRSKYVEIRPEKPDTPEKAKCPEFKTCKYTTEAIITDRLGKGEVRKVCTQPDCPSIG